MNIQTLDPNVIRKTGMEALAKKLGPVGMARFLRQFEIGTGDYTKERAEWLKNWNVKDIAKDIRKMRNK
ncbi:MAG: hypothetical protein HY756_11050 [Nitrospirae bacterium]|nr:hypothetical protein [Nitrospirota bacterium]